MASKITGFDDLENKLDSLGNVSRKIGMTAVRKGMRHALEQMKKDAPDNPSGVSSLGIKYDKRKGAKALKTTTSKYYPKTGSCVIRAGIDKKNWEDTKHLYFHHYGYENLGLGGKVKHTDYQKHIGWVTKSFNKALPKAEEEVIKTVQSEISKIIG